MSATREYRNLGYIEDASASVGAAIITAQTLFEVLTFYLPDDVDLNDIAEAFEALSAAHDQLQAALGV